MLDGEWRRVRTGWSLPGTSAPVYHSIWRWDPHRVMTTGLPYFHLPVSHLLPLWSGILGSHTRERGLGNTVSNLTRYTVQITVCSIIHITDASFIAVFGEGCLISFWSYLTLFCCQNNSTETLGAIDFLISWVFSSLNLSSGFSISFSVVKPKSLQWPNRFWSLDSWCLLWPYPPGFSLSSFIPITLAPSRFSWKMPDILLP